MKNTAEIPGTRSILGRLLFLFVVCEPCLAQSIRHFPIPSGVAGPVSITASNDGNVWFAQGFFDNQIGRITSSGQVTLFRPFSNPTDRAGGIAVDRDGSLWFTSPQHIGRIASSGVLTEFPLDSSLSPGKVTLGPDGNIWFAADGFLARITPTGNVLAHPLPTGSGRIAGLCSGPDGNLWFTEVGGEIGRMTLSGMVTKFSLPDAVGSLGDITPGSDGNLWFTQSEQVCCGKIGRITPQGLVTRYEIPTHGLPTFIVTNALGGITLGPNGNVWFMEGGDPGQPGRFRTSRKVAMITPNGLFSEFPLDSASSGDRPGDIVAGPDGALWFTSQYQNSIGRIELGACRLDEVCFMGDRFRARVQWTSPDGRSGVGEARPVTADTGAFWFFQPSNVELMVKLLDGRPVNGHFWVFYGSLTNVAFSLTLTDTQTGAVRTYSNAQGQLASFADTTAF